MGAKREGVVIKNYVRASASGVALRVSHNQRGNEYHKKWLQKPGSRDRLRAANRRYQKTDKGRAAHNAKKAKRRAIECQALAVLTPAEHLRINALYAEAARRTAETGIVHHVDHDVPLALGGLHHPDNMLVVTAAVNLAKGAHYASMKDFLNRNGRK